MPTLLVVRDARYFQVLFQLIFLSYGILFLQWKAEWLNYTIYIANALIFQWAFESFRLKKFLGYTLFMQSAPSAMISALSLCLLLKVNSWETCILASGLSISSKYIFHYRKHHFFNPSAFGIVATILITNDAWLSPGQWGSNTILVFAICCLGFIVVTKVQKLDLTLSFLLVYAGLLFFRQVFYLHWPIDFFIQSVSTGSLLLFSFFMISDPKTSPRHPIARIIWAMLIGATAFYLSIFKFLNSAPIWVLVPAALLVPVLNYAFGGKVFSWMEKTRTNHIRNIYSNIN